MSQRIAKVESLVQQVVASAIAEYVANSAVVTVTSVDVSPDMRKAIVWLGIVGAKSEVIFESVQSEVAQLQSALAKQLQTKFVPRLELRLDTGGEHAEHISKLLAK